MGKKDKKAVDIKIDEKEVKVEMPKSKRREEFKALIKAYTKKNPWKYGMKKEALEEQLKNIK